MADAPKILGTDTLRSAYPKINSSIDNANEALRTAETAKNAADTANIRAETAITNSENTQTQLDTIVLNGDSSVESAQARVAADGTTYSTLQARLNNADTKISNKAEKSEIGDLGSLTTGQKTSIVTAINEVNTKTKISNIDVFNDDPTTWVEGQIWALRKFALYEQTFTGADGTTGFTSTINTYGNVITSDAVISADERSVSGNQLRTLIKPTVNGKFVTRDFIVLNSIALPAVVGKKVNIEMLVTYDATVKENQFGIGFVNKNTNPGSGGTWTGTGFEGIRIHYSYATTLNAAYTAIQKRPGGDLVKVNNHPLKQGYQFKVRMEIENTGTNAYSIRWYEDGILYGQADGVSWTTLMNVFPYFYNQSANTNAQALFVDNFKVW